MAIRSKKILAAAKGQSCVNCGAADGTVVAAHYTGLRAHALGKGTGHKPHDLCIADLCHRCHAAFDQHEKKSDAKDDFMKKVDVSEQFLFLVIKTLLRRVDDGVVKIEGYKP